MSNQNQPYGVDISKHQFSDDGSRKVNFDKLNPLIKFCGVRAGISWGYTDPWYSYSKAHLIAPRLDYHVTYPGEDANRQMDHFLRITNPGEHDRLVLDLELDHGYSKYRITQTVLACLERLKKETGRYPIIYSRASWVDQFLQVSDLPTVASGPSAASMAGLDMVLYTETAVGDERAQIWGLAVPDSVPAGSYTITKTGGTNQRFFYATFTGVSSTAPVVDAAALRRGSATSNGTTLTVNCVKDGWVHDIVFANPAKNAGAGQTVIYNVDGRPGISYKNNLPAGSANMFWWWTNSRSAQAVVSLRPAPEQTIRPIIMF